MKHLLAYLTIVFCLGIACADFIRMPFPLSFLLAAFLFFAAILAHRAQKRFEIAVFPLIFFLGTLILTSSYLLPACHIVRLISKDKFAVCAVTGTVASEPVRKEKNVSFILKAEEVRYGRFGHNCCGEILVQARGKLGLAYADKVILTGRLYRLSDYTAYKLQGYRRYLRNQGIFSVMRAGNITICKSPKICVFRRSVLYLKARIEDIFQRHLKDASYGVMNAMVLGDKQAVPVFIYNLMVKTGTVHILVVSGFNVGIVAFLMVLFLKLIRIPRKARIIAAMPVLIAYCFLTGASTPVVRATIMAFSFMLADLLKRQANMYNGLSLAAICILVFNPRQLFDIGFQLSFASVFSIILLYPAVKSLLRLDSLRVKVLRFFAEGLIVSFSAWAGTMGLVAHYFKIFSPVTILANMIIAPLATLITLCGFSLISAGIIAPFFARYLSLASHVLVALLLNINSFLAKLPYAYFRL